MWDVIGHNTGRELRDTSCVTREKGGEKMLVLRDPGDTRVTRRVEVVVLGEWEDGGVPPKLAGCTDNRSGGLHFTID